MIVEWATRYLERRGHVVIEDTFLRDEDVFANMGPFTVLRRDAPFRVVSARARVVQPGETIAPSVPPGMPARGVYKPTEAGHRTRTVERCVGAFVFYDSGRSCTLPSWERWVRRTRAVLVG